MDSRKQLGIKIIGNYNKWFGLVGIFIGVFYLLAVSSSVTLERLEQRNITINFYKTKAIWIILSGIIMFILGNGLLHLKTWARKGAIVFSVWGIIAGLLPFFSASAFLPKRIISTTIGITINGFIIYYLFRPEIKTKFKEIGLKGIFWF